MDTGCSVSPMRGQSCGLGVFHFLPLWDCSDTTDTKRCIVSSWARITSKDNSVHPVWSAKRGHVSYQFRLSMTVFAKKQACLNLMRWSDPLYEGLQVMHCNVSEGIAPSPWHEIFSSAKMGRSCVGGHGELRPVFGLNSSECLAPAPIIFLFIQDPVARNWQ